MSLKHEQYRDRIKPSLRALLIHMSLKHKFARKSGRAGLRALLIHMSLKLLSPRYP